MITLLARWFIKDHNDYNTPRVREQYGTLCGGVGIFLNILLFAAKIIAGSFSGSIAVTADAFNNLSDAGSSVMTILGFKLAGRKPDPEHPYGHGRMEYVSGLMVAVLILLMAIELIKTSVAKIIHPEPLNTSWWVIGLLAAAIAVKLYMSIYNRRFGKLIRSSALTATADDSRNDCIATAVVLLSTLVSRMSGVNIDAWCGLLVGGFILVSGVKTALDTLGDLMGKAPDAELVGHIQELVLSHEGVLGMHDLVIHDYGPGRRMLSLHAEVSASGDMLELHDMIDNIECDLRDELGCAATIHMDPVSDDEKTVGLRTQVAAIIRTVDKDIEMHDFRVVEGPSHTNLIFDVVVPFRYRMTDAELKTALSEAVAAQLPKCRLVVEVDKDFSGCAERRS